METRLYSIEDLSGILKLHPKTILRFIHEGKLVARKIGRAWMVSEADLKNYVHSELSGRAEDETVSSGRPLAERISVSAVVEIDEQGSDEAGRVSNSLMAMLNCKDEAWGPTRFDFFYYPEIRKAKYVLYGTAKFIAAALGTFDSLCAPKED
jgi:excisionase family DNA binding protein